MARILLTGGTGFVGNAIFRSLVSKGHELIVTGRNNEQATSCPCISYTFSDLNWNSISPIDIVIHQAAITNTRHMPVSDFYVVNYDQSRKLYNDALKNGVKKFIYASSCAVYGKGPFTEDSHGPLNDYGMSKYMFDEWISWQNNSMTTIGLRYSNVYGSGEGHKDKSASMIWQLANQMKDGKKPQLFKYGEQSRDFVYIDDVVHANMLAMGAFKNGIYNIGSGKPTSFNEIFYTLKRVLNINTEVEYIDNPFVKQYQEFTSCDLYNANRDLGYYPSVFIDEGVERYFKEAS